MAETKESDETKQTPAESASDRAQREMEELMDQLLEMASPSVDEHKRKLLHLLIPVVLVVIELVSARLSWGEWQPTFELGAATLTAFGTIVLVLGALPSRRTAALMSTTFVGGNRHLLAELLKNRTAAWSGLVLILLGFLLQMTAFALNRLDIK